VAISAVSGKGIELDMTPQPALKKGGDPGARSSPQLESTAGGGGEGRNPGIVKLRRMEGVYGKNEQETST